MAKSLEATVEVTVVRLGWVGYNVQLRVTKPQPQAIEPEIDGFVMGLKVLRVNNIYGPLQRESVAAVNNNSSPK